MRVDVAPPLAALACATTAVAFKLGAVNLEGSEGVVEDVGPKHYWPNARGPIPRQYGASKVVVPSALQEHLAWTWQHPAGKYHTLLAGGPVIDHEKNLYQASSDSVRKFTPTGHLVWIYHTRGNTNNQPSLMGNAVFSSTKTGYAFAVNMDTGIELWATKLAVDAGLDCGYPAAYDGIFVVGGKQHVSLTTPGGNEFVFGLNATTGSKVWEFEPEQPVWNLAPLFPGDGTTVFMDYAGGLYSLDLHSGQLLWHTPPPGSNKSFSDGGATLGPNHVAYTCSNPGKGRGIEGQSGVLRAFSLDDGALLWERVFPQPCNSYPAVGHLSKGGPLAVVVTPGSFPGAYKLHGSILAYEAKTGEPIWQYQAPAYRNFMGFAAGDLEGMPTRSKLHVQAMCVPAHWSAAYIAGDGTVFAGRCDGFLYAVRALPLVRNLQTNLTGHVNFATTPGVTAETFDAGAGFLHGAMAFAPGMMASQSCDTLYVFEF